MRVLIADDDRLVCDLVGEMVRACGHEVAAIVSGGGLAVIKAFGEIEPDLTLLDVFMPRCNGLTVCHALLSKRPEAKVVLMSGMAQGNHPFVTGSGAAAFLQKPIRFDEIRQLLAKMSPEGAELDPEVKGGAGVQGEAERAVA